MNRRRLGFLAIVSLAAALISPAPGLAQTVTSAMTGAMTGPDRTARLIAGAKKEATLTLYSSTAVEDMTPLISAFEKTYGVKVRVWRGASGDILQRALTEARGGRYEVDVIETTTAEMEVLAREGQFQAVNSPVFADLIPEARPAATPWVGSRLILYNIAYNTNLVRAADLPKRYEDLIDPKWKGKIGIEASDSNWFMALVSAMGEEKGVKLFRDVAARNGLSVRKGHTLLTSLVISGEVPIAWNVYRHETIAMKKLGAPIAELNLSPSIAQMAAAGAMKRAPHPHAAMLFMDFLLSDGQKIWADLERVPTNRKYQKLPPGLALTFIDAPRFVRENAKWERLYREILTSQRR